MCFGEGQIDSSYSRLAIDGGNRTPCAITPNQLTNSIKKTNITSLHEIREIRKNIEIYRRAFIASTYLLYSGKDKNGSMKSVCL